MHRCRQLLCSVPLVLVLVAPGRVHAQQPFGPQRANALGADLSVDLEALTSVAQPQVPDPLPIRLPEPLRPSQAQSNPSQLEIKQQTILLFHTMSQDRHHDLSVTLKRHKAITGRILSADSDGFVFRPRHSQQQTTIRYEDLDHWKQVPTEGTQVLQTTVLVLITIPLFPFFFLCGLAGWQC
jgi:hypothetical protein